MDSQTVTTYFASPERASQESLQEQQHLISQQELVKKFLNSVPDIIAVLNENRQIVYANQALTTMLGLNDTTEVCGLRVGEAVDCIHAFELEGGCGTTEFCRVCGAMRAILAGQKGQSDVQECRIQRRDGSALDLRVWASPLTLENENLTILSMVDISYEKRRHALERIFFHDVLNTAAALRGLSELMKDTSLEEMEGALVTITNLSDQLIDEIRAQRELVAAENHELIPHPMKVNSLDLCLRTIKFYRNHSYAAGRIIQIDPDTANIDFNSDRILLNRVLGNLIKNALEASIPNQIIHFGCKSENGRLIFWVQNSSYMPREVQLQIFQRSFSTKGSGRGLGTYSIKLLTERYLKGEVSFTSSEENGTTFYVSYPLDLTKKTESYD